MRYFLLYNGMLLFGSHVLAETGEAVYQSKCMTCHDSGAGNAPRVNVRADWLEREKRGRAAMHESALKGIPATAMAARGGYVELSDADVRATVDYMLKRVGFRDVVLARPAVVTAVPAAPAGVTAAPVSDATLVDNVARALQKVLAPGARVELHDGQATVRGLNIRVVASAGVVTLSGAVEKGELIPRAQGVAQAVPGVRSVVNRVVAAGMLDFD